MNSERVQNLFSTQIFFMKLFGNISPKIENFLPPAFRNVGIVATKLLCAFRVFLTLHIVILFVATAFDSFYYGKLADFTDALVMLIIYSFATFACLYWIVFSNNLQSFFDDVNKHYQYLSKPGLTYVNAYSPYIIAKKMTIYWLCACIAGVVFWALSPLMLRRRILAVKCWYPFDINEGYTFEILFSIQFLAQCQMGATFGNGSAMYVSCILIMLGQFDILFCSLKNIQSHSEILAGKSLQKIR
ncbi:putative odorant receptor 85e [Episyrphus balteatus]|uniref:putative odorant receptor 85e n=1 Tax=Episyrphus balteatus TaxID=286459 RepID=UPI0024867A39|nr:putative odorant receptor 85e [Episyrphus balteatus]